MHYNITRTISHRDTSIYFCHYHIFPFPEHPEGTSNGSDNRDFSKVSDFNGGL